MASTVIQAFNEFLANTVNLRKEDTQTARSSRDWPFSTDLAVCRSKNALTPARVATSVDVAIWLLPAESSRSASSRPG